LSSRPNLDALSIATIRTLCIDAIQAANTGHPGTPMGMAPDAYPLWQRFLRFDPAVPIWPNRDRFVPGVERRLGQGLDPAVGSVASVFMSRRDAAVADRVPDELKDRLALAVGMKTYAAYRALLDSDAPFTVDTIPGETCGRSPITVRSAIRCRPTAGTPRRRSRGSPQPASTSRHSPRSCRRRAPSPSSRAGTTRWP
jgi:hypothetical protein